MERNVAAEFERLINAALDQVSDIEPQSSAYQHAGSTKRSLDAALLADAARARGLEVLPLSEEAQVIRDERRTVGFYKNMPWSLTLLDRLITNDKDLTKRVLREADLPVARSRLVTSLAEAAAYFRELACPVVVKPRVGSNGRGITVGVRTEAELAVAVAQALERSPRVLVEECVTSIDLRVTVIAGRAAAAMMRVPANVVGDGASTVAELIERKNAHRAANAFHRFVPIVVSDDTRAQLAAHDLALDSVIEAGRRVFLHYKANLSSGGDSINITDRIHPDFLRLAERATKCFGSVRHAGVDILAERLDQPPAAQRTVICEINCNNDLPIHVFPLFGDSIQVDRLEIEAYFPGRGRPWRRLRPAWLGRASGEPAARGRSSQDQPGGTPAAFTRWSGWPELADLLARPVEPPAGGPDFDTARQLDAARLGAALAEAGWANVRNLGPLFFADLDGHEIVLERSGRSVFAGTVARDPELLSTLLADAGLPVRRAGTFTPDGLAEAEEFFDRAPGPWDLRPAERRAGGLARYAFRHKRTLTEAWPRYRERELPVVLEQAAHRFAVRLLLVEGEVAACLLQVPVTLVGDGTSTVRQLAERKRALRTAHPYLRHHPLRESTFGERTLARRTLTAGSVLGAGERVPLSGSPLVEAGGETVGYPTCPVPGLVETGNQVVSLLGGAPVAAVTFAARRADDQRRDDYWLVTDVVPDPVLAPFAWPWAGHAPGTEVYRRVAGLLRQGQRYELSPVAMQELSARR